MKKKKKNPHAVKLGKRSMRLQKRKYTKKELQDRMANARKWRTYKKKDGK